MRKPGIPGVCSICGHTERARLDYLVAVGNPVAAVAKRFKVSGDSLWRHYKNHVTAEFKRTVRLGPFESEERLRALCADGGASVLETLRAIRAPLTARYMAAFEAGADQAMIQLAGKMHRLLMDEARLTQELAPPPASVHLTQNVLLTPGWFEGFSQKMVEFARRHPEVREDLMAVLRESVSEPADRQLLNVTQALPRVGEGQDACTA